MSTLALLDALDLPEPEGRPYDELTRLAERAGGGDRSALGDLFERLADELYGFALWSCASPDLAAEALAALFARLVARPDLLAHVSAPRPYLFRAVAREARHLVARRDRELPAERARFLLAQRPEGRDLTIDLEQALSRLPRAQREALYLRYFAGLELAEIGRTTGVPKFTAASRCRLGLARLRKLLEARP